MLVNLIFDKNANDMEMFDFINNQQTNYFN